jgi:hypothetical protein
MSCLVSTVKMKSFCVKHDFLFSITKPIPHTSDIPWFGVAKDQSQCGLLQLQTIVESDVA